MQVWSRSRMSWPNQPSKCRGVLLECGVAGDPLFHRQVAGEHCHGVGCWPHPNPTMLTFGAAPLHITPPISLIGDLADT